MLHSKWPRNSKFLQGCVCVLYLENYIDVAEVKKSSNSSSWWDICQMTDKGAILVRPDEHVAWRLKSHTKDQETDGINLKLK
ncbi:hypothetical protein ACFX1X_021651 [Malus domestica]